MTIEKILELEAQTTEGKWVVNEMTALEYEDCFVECLPNKNEVYGQEIMAEDYEGRTTKHADAEFIVACKQFFMEMNNA